MREKYRNENRTSSVTYEENKLLSFHRQSSVTSSFRVHKDGQVGIHYQVGELGDAEGFQKAEENLGERPRSCR